MAYDNYSNSAFADTNRTFTVNQTYILPSVKPNITIISPTDNSYFNVTNITLNFTVTDETDANLTCWYDLDGNITGFVMNSTLTVQLQDANTENLDDATVTEQNNVYNVAGNVSNLYVSEDYATLTIGGYDTFAENINLSGLLMKQTWILPTKSPYNYTTITLNSNAIADCLSATTITAKAYSGSSPLVLEKTGTTASCGTGGLTVTIGFEVKEMTTYWIGFETDSNITMKVDTGGEVNDWSYNNGISWIAQDNVGYHTDIAFSYGDTYTLMSFDTNQANGIVNSANLCSYVYMCSGSTGTNITVYEVNQSWNEETVQWNATPTNKGVLLASNLIASTTDDAWWCWNVTNGINLSNSNNSFIFKFDSVTSDNNDYCIINSKEYITDIAKRPYLNITYTTTENVNISNGTYKTANLISLSEGKHNISVICQDSEPQKWNFN